jgi:hypothetical protein
MQNQRGAASEPSSKGGSLPRATGSGRNITDILATARDYGLKARKALDDIDTRAASQCWHDYVSWYQGLLDSGRMNRRDIDAVDAVYRDAERGRLV